MKSVPCIRRGISPESASTGHGRHIAVFVAQIVRGPQTRGDLQIVVPQFRQHVVGRDIVGIIVKDAL